MVLENEKHEPEADNHGESRKRTYTINGRILYEFNPSNRELLISTDDKSLKALLGVIGQIPKGGIEFINLPLPVDQTVRFDGVKRIMQMGDRSTVLIAREGNKKNLKYAFMSSGYELMRLVE